jgi:YHS domain-containing protein
MKKLIASVMGVFLVAAATAFAADVDLEGVKCVVAPRAAKMDKSAEYKDANVYFCCGNCQGKFTSAPKKFAVPANHQLVATKQYEQKACPFSGGDVNPATALKLSGAKVGFCCNNCKGKVEAAEDDKAKMKMVFNDKAFAKGFKKAEKKES